MLVARRGRTCGEGGTDGLVPVHGHRERVGGAPAAVAAPAGEHIPSARRSDKSDNVPRGIARLIRSVSDRAAARSDGGGQGVLRNGRKRPEYVERVDIDRVARGQRVAGATALDHQEMRIRAAEPTRGPDRLLVGGGARAVEVRVRDNAVKRHLGDAVRLPHLPDEADRGAGERHCDLGSRGAGVLVAASRVAATCAAGPTPGVQQEGVGLFAARTGRRRCRE